MITLGPGELFVDGKPLGTVLAEDIFLEDEETPSFIKSINPVLSASEEMSFECDIDPRMLDILTGVDLARGADSYTVVCTAPYREQIRRHRKKRINKKWAKRYGYRTRFRNIEMTDVTFRETGPCTFEGIVENRIKEIKSRI